MWTFVHISGYFLGVKFLGLLSRKVVVFLRSFVDICQITIQEGSLDLHSYQRFRECPFPSLFVITKHQF
jgi:hypothetical protein